MICFNPCSNQLNSCTIYTRQQSMSVFFLPAHVMKPRKWLIPNEAPLGGFRTWIYWCLLKVHCSFPLYLLSCCRSAHPKLAGPRGLETQYVSQKKGQLPGLRCQRFNNPFSASVHHLGHWRPSTWYHVINVLILRLFPQVLHSFAFGLCITSHFLERRSTEPDAKVI